MRPPAGGISSGGKTSLRWRSQGRSRTIARQNVVHETELTIDIFGQLGQEMFGQCGSELCIGSFVEFQFKVQLTRHVLLNQLVVVPDTRVALPPVSIYEPSQVGAYVPPFAANGGFHCKHTGLRRPQRQGRRRGGLETGRSSSFFFWQRQLNQLFYLLVPFVSLPPPLPLPLPFLALLK